MVIFGRVCFAAIYLLIVVQGKKKIFTNTTLHSNDESNSTLHLSQDDKNNTKHPNNESNSSLHLSKDGKNNTKHPNDESNRSLHLSQDGKNNTKHPNDESNSSMHLTQDGRSIRWIEKENFRVSPGCDLPGDDIKSEASTNSDDCRSKCANMDECTHFTSNPLTGLCWLKRGKGTGNNAVSITQKEVVCGFKKSKKNVAEKGGQLTKWQQKEGFRVSPNCDFPVNDIGDGVKAPDASQCQKKCTQLKECTHFTWNHANGGICYLKKGDANEKTAISFDDENVFCGFKKS